MAHSNNIDYFSLLMVDDDPDDLELIADAFKEIGYKLPIKTFNDGIQMLHYLLSRPVKEPALLLLDLNMPKNGGRYILDKIRHHPELQNISVIIYSTSNAKEDILEAYHLGCNAYVVKPNCYSEIKKIAAGIKRLWFDTNNLLKFRFAVDI